MEELINEIKGVVEKELERASEKYGDKHNSAAEAYAVLKEEIEETVEELECVQEELEAYWDSVRERRELRAQIDILLWLERCAIQTAAESVQVAAMARKAKRGYGTQK